MGMDGSHADEGEPCGRRGAAMALLHTEQILEMGVMERMERMGREKPGDVASAGFRNAIDYAWSHAAGKFK